MAFAVWRPYRLVLDSYALLGCRYYDLTPLFRYDSLSRLAAGPSVLNNCRRVQGVDFRHGSCRSCLKGTRETVLGEIELWAKNFSMSPVFWLLNGLAGTGKSTIAQTVSEQFLAKNGLGGPPLAPAISRIAVISTFYFLSLPSNWHTDTPNSAPTLWLSSIRTRMSHESLYDSRSLVCINPPSSI